MIGGNGFIGSPLVSELLGSGHEVAVFHRRSDVGLADSGVVQIQGDRNRLSDYEGQLRRFSPDVIVDLILSWRLAMAKPTCQYQSRLSSG